MDIPTTNIGQHYPGERISNLGFGSDWQSTSLNIA